MMLKSPIYIGILLILVCNFSCCNQRNQKLTDEQKASRKETFIKANKGLVALDQERIDAYVKRRGWAMQTTQTGLWYQIYEPGNGPLARTGQIAHLKYVVSLLDGTVCYTSDSLGIMNFKIGQGGVESGLEEAILLMHEGDKGRFIMPPGMAHGLLGDENKIPRRSIIVYHVELLNLTSE